MPAIRVCPKCGSENIKLDPTNPRAAAGFSVQTYLCGNCGFSGSFFPEIDKS